ncbi:MAG: hypothetical protein RRB13_12885 [bacterium]|nr:hypothetical protein [bacterium]
MRIPEGFIEADVVALHQARVLFKSPKVAQRWAFDPYAGLERETGYSLFFEDLQMLAEAFGLPFDGHKAEDFMLVQDRNVVAAMGFNSLSHHTGLEAIYVKEEERRLWLFAVFAFDFQDQQLGQTGRYGQKISYQGPYTVWYAPEEVALSPEDEGSIDS